MWASVLSGESLERIILALMKGWSLDSDVDIQLSAADADALSETLIKKLKNELLNEKFCH